MADFELSASAAAIRCEAVTKQFPGASRPAVDRVSFEAEAGSLVVLLGPSGCGKTTLLKMINRLYEPTSGQILINGTEIHAFPITDLRRHIGYVIQQVGLFPHMSVAENIGVVPRLLGWDRARIDARTGELLELVGLPPAYRARRPRQLSGGEAQRVGLARALAADPPILLMDEPFAAIDALARARLQEELRQIHQRLHKTVLFVTHDVEEAFRLADRILLLNQGQLVQYAPPIEMVTHPADEFTRQLLGSGNLIRRLSLIPVRAVLAEHAAGETGSPPGRLKAAGPLYPEDNLRTALTHLLASGTDRVSVVDPAGRPVGQVTFEDLRRALADGQADLPPANTDELPGP